MAGTDGSAVSGKVVTRNANGAGNIAELSLDATQIGDSTGLLSQSRGGAAPQHGRRRRPDRPCDPQATPIVNVPYQADYVFING